MLSYDDHIDLIEYGYAMSEAGSSIGSVRRTMSGREFQLVSTFSNIRGTEVLLFKFTSTYGGAAKIVFVFVGSNQVYDWFVNFWAWGTRTKYGKMHRGYYRSWKNTELRQWLEFWVDHYRFEMIHFNGHSAGGALVKAFHLDYKKELRYLRSLTIGAPKVFKKRQSTTFIKCYKNKWDIVPKMPFWNKCMKVIKRIGGRHAVKTYRHEQ